MLFGAITCYPVDSPVRAGELASAIAGLADDTGLPLMVDLRPDGVTIDSGKDQWEDGKGSATNRFVDLAGRIQTAARDLGLSADLTRPRFVQFGIDAVDVPAVRALWASVLGYQHDPRAFVTDIHDPRRLNPVLFFQPMDASDTERRQHRNRIHVDLFVPHDQAQARIDAAIALHMSVRDRSRRSRAVEVKKRPTRGVRHRFSAQQARCSGRGRCMPIISGSRSARLPSAGKPIKDKRLLSVEQPGMIVGKSQTSGHAEFGALQAHEIWKSFASAGRYRETASRARPARRRGRLRLVRRLRGWKTAP